MPGVRYNDHREYLCVQQAKAFLRSLAMGGTRSYDRAVASCVVGGLPRGNELRRHGGVEDGRWQARKNAP
ncbi:MAG: hypothetical protein ACJASD_001547 [Sphingomonas echinoides]|jgi:hypothetical protein